MLKEDGAAVDALNLGALLRRLGRLSEATSHYQNWLKAHPKELTLRLNAVNCLLEAGNIELANQWILEGLKLEPEQIELLQCRARTLMSSGKRQESQQILENIVKKKPKEINAWLDLGLCRHLEGNHALALKAFKEAAHLDPNNSKAVANQIRMLEILGEWTKAENLIDNCNKELRENPKIRGSVARLLISKQKLEEAAKEYKELCKIEPHESVNWLNLAACLRNQQYTHASKAILKEGLLRHPKNNDLKQAFGQALAALGKHKQALKVLEEGLKTSDPNSKVHLFNLQFIGAGYGLLSAKRRTEIAKNWESHQYQEGVGALWGDRIRSPIGTRKIRIGYLSADFCKHPVGRFMLPILKNHDHDKVEIFGLNCTSHNDELTEEIKKYCDKWLDLRFANDLEAARLISDNKLDIIVELGGYTAGSRLGILVHKPAPIQLSYLGYFAPTYLNCIDGWIGDKALFDGLDSEDKKQNQLILKGGYMAYNEKDLPETKRAQNDYFRFGSFNHSRKLGEKTITLFNDVMKSIPNTQLVLKSISFVEKEEQERIKKLFIEAGLEKERLILIPYIDGQRNHLASYEEIDVALDPLPYGGATTTCESLIMGIPVITLAGDGMVGRLSSSILMHSGCKQWIANNKKEFIKIAKSLYKEGKRSSAKRNQLRQAINNSPLCDGERLSSELETLYFNNVFS